MLSFNSSLIFSHSASIQSTWNRASVVSVAYRMSVTIESSVRGDSPKQTRKMHIKRAWPPLDKESINTVNNLKSST
jgi:hypothetical protein